MQETLKPKIVGRVIITEESGKVLLDQSNAIGSDAFAIICRCMGQLNGTKQVDTLRARGSGFDVTVPIELNQYNNVTNGMLFRGTLLESSFNGTLTDLELLSNSLDGSQMATKTGINIFKDNLTRLRVDWTIIIN
jgi:hypothetical protein